MSALTTVTKTANTQTLRALVERLLPSLEWRHHGIGVLQGYVREDADPEIRVHIWSRDLARPGMEASGDVHDHRCDLVSHVLVGRVVHEEWFAAPDVAGTLRRALAGGGQ